MRSPLPAATPLLAAIIWVLALAFEPGPYEWFAVLLMGVGLLAMATVSVVGMVVVGGRWARRLALGSVGACGLVALVRPLDGLWLAGLVAGAVAGASLFLPAVTLRIRKLPAATGPPARAVTLPLLLVVTPFLIGLAGYDTAAWPSLVVGLSAPLVAFAYSRVVPGGLWALRILWPLLAIALAVPAGWPAGAVSAVLGAVVAIIAWHPSVKTAYHPPREVGTTYPIPPELAPKDILDAAEIDDRGRPQ